jgi:SAM-dependent methyltransferase
MKFRERYYPESLFGGFTDIDGTIAFYARVNALLKPSFRIVDFGCGRGANVYDEVAFRCTLTNLRGKVSRVIGLDVDPAASVNPKLDEFHLLPSGGSWPLESKSVNLIVSDSVLEHLPDPALFFRESKRVLVDGGFLCVRTPNKVSYIGIISRLIPNRHHRAVLGKAQPHGKEEDVFPTLYRCNTVTSLRWQMERHGFKAAIYGYEAEPSYLAFAGWAYRLGVLHQRFAPSFLKPAIFGFGELRG